MNKKGRKSTEESASLDTEANRLTVLVSGQFCTKGELMRQFSIGDPRTFEKYFGDLYRQSADFWKSTAAKAFYKALTKGDSANIKHGAKTILGLNEKRDPDDVIMPTLNLHITPAGKDE